MEVKLLGADGSQHLTGLGHAILQAASSTLTARIKSRLTSITIEFSSERGLSLVRLSLELEFTGATISGTAKHTINDVHADTNRFVSEAINRLQRAVRDTADKHQQLAADWSGLAHAFFPQSDSV